MVARHCDGDCGNQGCRISFLEDQLADARAEVARLQESIENLDGLYVSRTDSLRECEAELRTVAERQREACAAQLHNLLTKKKATAVWVGADEIRATPLVTEDES